MNKAKLTRREVEKVARIYGLWRIGGLRFNMPMPHEVQMQLIKERLVGKEGKAKLDEIRKIQA